MSLIDRLAGKGQRRDEFIVFSKSADNGLERRIGWKEKGKAHATLSRNEAGNEGAMEQRSTSAYILTLVLEYLACGLCVFALGHPQRA